MRETCPSCGSDSGHYHRDGRTPGEEVWICESCWTTYIIRVKNEQAPFL